MNRSRQRDLILAYLRSTKSHPSADQVFQEVRQQEANISLGTVYRNLTLLSEIGEIQKIRVGDGIDHFDADLSEHFHFICKECDAVIDLPGSLGDAFSKVNQEAADQFDGSIDGYKAYFFGTCPSCLAEAKQH